MRRQKLWFKRKKYGWGWTPVTKEGWFTLFGYLIAVYSTSLGTNFEDLSGTPQLIFFGKILLFTTVLISLCFVTGEKPRWQWGNKRRTILSRKSEKKIEEIDADIIHIIRKISPILARVAIFVVFFWFGALKLVGTSPANPLVDHLLQVTLPFVTFNQFIFFFGVYEMVIGLTFLLPHLERLAIIILIPHMITTLLPLIFLAPMTWQGFMTPTMEGQYIIKNLLIVALALGIAARLHPMKMRK